MCVRICDVNGYCAWSDIDKVSVNDKILIEKKKIWRSNKFIRDFLSKG